MSSVHSAASAAKPSAPRLPAFFIPHGAGPCFFMPWTRGPADSWDATAAFLRSIAQRVGERPKAILVISGHWEAPVFSVTSGLAPSLIYDYSGFPPSTYTLTYPAPGDAQLAKRVQDLLRGAGLASAADATRGWDHGVFIPLKVMYPNADVPVVQLSLKQGLDPLEHLAAGRALAPLREEGVLMVGSGMSFHNTRGFWDPGYGPISEQFDAWLKQTVEAPAAQRESALTHWSEAPSGRAAHPREEHLLPLMVVAGAAREHAGHRVFFDRISTTALSGYAFA